MIFLGLLIVFVLYFLSVILNGIDMIGCFFDLPSLVIVAVGVAFHIVRFGPQYFLPGLKTIFRLPRPELGEVDPHLGKYYWQLTGFTLGLGTFVAFAGLLLSIGSYRNLDVTGYPVAICLFAPTYTILITLTLFLPISLRHLPDSVDPKRFPTGFTFAGFANYFIARAMMITLLVAIATLPKEQTGLSMEPPPMNAELILRQTFFTLNPADLFGGSYLQFPFLVWFWDPPGLIMILGVVGAFRLAVGRIHNRWTWTPVCILYGVLGTLLGMIIMSSNIDVQCYSPGCMVSLITAFYGMAAAICLAIGGWRPLVLVFFGFWVAAGFQTLIFDLYVTDETFKVGFVVFSFLFALFLLILWDGMKKTWIFRSAEPQLPLPPLTEEEKQAQRILDKVVEEGKK